MTRRIFIAGKWEAQLRLRAERANLVDAGLGVVSSGWLDEPGGGYWDTMRIPRLLSGYRNDRDIRYVASERRPRGLFLLDTIDPGGGTGGREVELGFALAIGLEAWCIGPRRNIYHERLPQFDSWDEARASLEKERREAL
jgi:hypothetical protein